MKDHDKEDIPVLIKDLREQLPEIRDQGMRPLCLVFAASDANSKANSCGESLSTEYLAYYSYKNSGRTDYDAGLNILEVDGALSNQGQPKEHVHPYNPHAKSTKEHDKESLVGEDIYFGSFKRKSRDFESIKKVIETGVPAVIVIKITREFLSGKLPAIYSENKNASAVHAVIVCGIGELNGVELLLIKNSWGEQWGMNGYAWITSGYVSSHVFNVEIIEIEKS